MKVAIIGGGITGLAAAYRLEQMNPLANIILFEKKSHLGGKLLTDCADPFVLEGGADSFLSRKPRGIGLCEELGIADQLIGRRPENRRTYVKRFGHLHPLPEGLSGFVPTDLRALENHPLLSTAGWERIQQEPHIRPFEGEDDESLAAFMIRRLGREAFENIVEPLMSGIFAGDAQKLSLLATYPNLRQVEQEHGSLLRGLANRNKAGRQPVYPPFVSFAGGMAILIETIGRALKQTEIITGVTVRAVSRADDRWQVITEDQALDFDYILLTTPTYASGRLVENLDTKLAAMLNRISYASTAVVHLAFPKNKIDNVPQSYGYVIPRAEQSDILACSWSSQKWVDRAPDDTLLLRVFMGRAGGQDILQHDDEALVMKAVNEIRQTLKLSAAPTFYRVYRWPQSMPQYNLGHQRRIETVRNRLTHHRGLMMAGAAFEGVGIPNCIASAEAAAEAILDDELRVRADNTG